MRGYDEAENLLLAALKIQEEAYLISGKLIIPLGYIDILSSLG